MTDGDSSVAPRPEAVVGAVVRRCLQQFMQRAEGQPGPEPEQPRLTKEGKWEEGPQGHPTGTRGGSEGLFIGVN